MISTSKWPGLITELQQREVHIEATLQLLPLLALEYYKLHKASSELPSHIWWCYLLVSQRHGLANLTRATTCIWALLYAYTSEYSFFHFSASFAVRCLVNASFPGTLSAERNTSSVKYCWFSKHSLRYFFFFHFTATAAWLALNGPDSSSGNDVRNASNDFMEDL